MAKIIKNTNYVASDDVKQTGKYLFDAEDGSELVECTVWLEKSKATEKHPNGKPWIRCPKMTEVTNRGYFSEDLFLNTDTGDGVTVEVKTAPPRVLGASGVKQDVLKYLDETTAEEYTNMVNAAVAAFKEAKSNAKKKKPEEMTKEELEEYIAALREGRKVTVAAKPKSFLDMFTQEQYDRYNEILALAAENKANAPKAQRKPLTEAEKAARAEKRRKTELSKAEALLAALMSSAATEAAPEKSKKDAPVEEEDYEDDDE
jgi:hypothetical protein